MLQRRTEAGAPHRGRAAAARWGGEGLSWGGRGPLPHSAPHRKGASRLARTASMGRSMGRSMRGSMGGSMGGASDEHGGCWFPAARGGSTPPLPQIGLSVLGVAFPAERRLEGGDDGRPRVGARE